jgi:hypothetical protein
LHGHEPVDVGFFLWDLFSLADVSTLDTFLRTSANAIGDEESDDEGSVEDEIDAFQSFTGETETSALPI